MDPRFQKIWNMAVNSMSEDAPSETDLNSRSATDLEWLKDAMESGAAGADNDVIEMLDALKSAAAGNNTADNLHLVAEFCEDLDFARVAVTNRCIGVCLKYLAFKDARVRAAAARLLAAISQNLPDVQQKTVNCLQLLIKLAAEETDDEALRFQISAISSTSRFNRRSIKTFFELNGAALMRTIFDKSTNERVVTRTAFFANRLVEEAELVTDQEMEENRGKINPTDGLERAEVVKMLRKSLVDESVQRAKRRFSNDNIDLMENLDNLLQIFQQ